QQQQQQQQQPYEQQQPYQTLQYKVSQKGLSPPPRAKRLPNGPLPGHESLSPSSPVSPPARDTFMMNGSTTTLEGYSDTPRIGGGVRRKSLKGIEEDETGVDPSWPLPPRLD
ncbi:hypothetical protein BGZ90_001335, partial [Linnemannia elongata]